MAKPKKPAHIDKRVGRHRLYAERGVTGWYFAGTFEEIAAKYDGCQDASEALTLFEQLATGAKVEDMRGKTGEVAA